MTTQQVETATVAGTVTLTGNASITVTAYGMGNSPKTISVAVTNGDTASIVGGLVRTALAFDSDVAAMFLISGSGANVVLTKHVATASDSTLNVAIANGTCTGLTAAPTSTNTTAGDGLDHAYTTLAKFKKKAVTGNQEGITENDALLELALNSASRSIEKDYCSGRRFYAVSETRYYTYQDDDYCVKVDDICSDSGVTITLDVNADGTHEVTLGSTDYQLAPYNSLLNNEPFTEIELTPTCVYGFPTVRKGVSVTASFGYSSSTPSKVEQACLLLAERTYKRYITILGQAGSNALGEITLDVPGDDPDVRRLLAEYRKMQ